MKLKILLFFSFLLSISILYSQDEITITQNYTHQKFNVKNTLTLNDASITFSNRYFTIIQTREELSYLIYFHKIRSYWVGNANSFDEKFYRYLIINTKSIDDTDKKSNNIITRLNKSNNVYFKNDSIVLIDVENIYSKVVKSDSIKTIANYDCNTFNYYISTNVSAKVSKTDKLTLNASADLRNLWHIIFALNNVINTELSINLSFINNSNTYPMQVIFYNKDMSILKKETVSNIEMHGISGCQCNKYKEYQKLSLINLLIGAETENNK
ncbi:MAG: hypothetical protein DRI86_07310 [Bacteroidetes bacterium]|nr:MAG: hypothetical protein DRI86_07310 [Bacteroidota bacterium]